MPGPLASGPPVEDRPRLNKQCEQILAMLRTGPKTNDDLARVALKYTSRISDLRKAGHNIQCQRIKRGLTKYRLIEPAEPEPKPAAAPKQRTRQLFDKDDPIQGVGI